MTVLPKIRLPSVSQKKRRLSYQAPKRLLEPLQKAKHNCYPQTKRETAFSFKNSLLSVLLIVSLFHQNLRTTSFGNTSLTRNSQGNITRETLQDGLQESMGYRADGRLVNYSVVGAANENRNYNYDVRGRLTEEPYNLINSLNLSALSNGTQTADYTFDQLGVRLKQVVAPGASNEVESQNTFSQATQDLNFANQWNSSYDGLGEVTSRSIDGGAIQNFTWDSFGHLVEAAQSKSDNNNYSWSTIYDGLGRRIQTTYQGSDQTATLGYYYDPEVEFLELGHSVNGSRTWNLYGPDRSGSYGGAQGIGGLEATYNENSHSSCGVLNNYFGDALGTISSGTFTSYNSVLGGYGPMPGSDVNHNLEPEWRGHYLDWTGFYYMGARYYDPNTGRFLSADPLGHSASMDLYSYCNGDPVNGLDPDGRCVEGTSAGWANGNGSFAGTYDSSQANSKLDYGLGWTFGGALGDVNAAVARPVAYAAALSLYGLNTAVESTEEYLGGPGARGAIGFMAPLMALEMEAAASRTTAIEETGVVSKTMPPLRQAYETDVKDLNGLSLSARAAGQDAEATAKMIHAERNDLKLQYRELTPANLLKKMEQRNIKIYGNPLGPTIEDLRSQGKTWEQIIESASRPGGRDINF